MVFRSNEKYVCTGREAEAYFRGLCKSGIGPNDISSCEIWSEWRVVGRRQGLRGDKWMLVWKSSWTSGWVETGRPWITSCMYQRKVVLPFLQLEDSLHDTGVLKRVILWLFVLLCFLWTLRSTLFEVKDTDLGFSSISFDKCMYIPQ